ncbi:MAG: endonuclease/exonuclease/phosphatase family protein [Polyangiales bacterium]
MKLRVASYNVHGFVGRDGKCDVERIARVVRALDADAIALQEVTFDQPPLELPGYRSFSTPVQRMELPFGNQVLTRLPILSQRTICLSFLGREPRNALEVVLETGARPLRVIATHLGLRPGERRYQVKRILEHVGGDEQSVTVLLGDFNEWFLLGRPLRWLHARFGRGPAVATYPARFPLFALDRVWVHPRQALQRFSAYPAARTESDHLPVLADLEL